MLALHPLGLTLLGQKSLSNRLRCAITHYVLSVRCVRLEHVEGALPFRFPFHPSRVNSDIILRLISANNKLIYIKHRTISLSYAHR